MLIVIKIAEGGCCTNYLYVSSFNTDKTTAVITRISIIRVAIEIASIVITMMILVTLIITKEIAVSGEKK